MENLKSIHLVLVGRWFFALAIIGIGTEHFIFEDFILGRAPAWPGSLSGKFVWAYLSGIVFIITGLTIITNKKARYTALLTGTLVFLWAFLRDVPVIAMDSFLSGKWTEAGKALTFFGGAFVIAATFPEVGKHRNTYLHKLINLHTEYMILGRICLGIFLVITGVQHFMFAEFVASLIPEWFPGDAVNWTFFAGVALIAGGIGLFIPQTARLAAFFSGLMVFSWFWIVHIPRAFTSTTDGIAVFEALAVSGIAFVLAGFNTKA